MSLTDEQNRGQQSPWRWLTVAAFVIAVAVVIGRSAMNEMLRDPFPVVYGQAAGARPAGPATGMVLNLLVCLPALLVLLRRVVDHTFRLRLPRSFLPVAALAAWMALSPLWAGGDRFAAVVAASHWLAAFVLLWTAAQLVRDWKDLRLVAGVCLGLLLLYTTHGIIYRFVEWPILLENWEQQREQFLAMRGWEEGHYLAEQFAGKIERGEIVAFGSSPNTYAAMLVLLGVVTAGLIVQRIRLRDEWLWPGIMLAALPPALWVLYHTHSRTAWALVVLAAALLGGVALLRRWLAAYPRAAFAAAAALIVLIGAAVVGHGLRHGSLFHPSLTFRWMYWVGSAEMFRDHWLLGVGWKGFGQHYLAYRLPAAPEEIQDPHNFIVRFATELGVVGLVLLLAWMGRLWWELTRPNWPVEQPLPPRPLLAAPSAETALPFILLLAGAGMAVNIISSLDWSIPLEDRLLELVGRLLYLCVLVVGIVVAGMVSTQRQVVDGRASPWVLYGLLVGLGLFLLHNLVDFALFDPGPLYVFALLAGAGLGIRSPEPIDRAGGEAGVTPASRSSCLRAFVPSCLLGLAVLLWAAGLVFVVSPIVRAEEIAYAADQNVRAGYFQRAADQYERAFQLVPYNADYLHQRALALIMLGAAPPDVRATLARAIAADPMATQYYLLRARYELRQRPPDREQARADFERVLELDPAALRIRMEYAQLLAAMGETEAARRQYELVLWYDEQLMPWGQVRRLSEAERQQVDRALREPGGR